MNNTQKLILAVNVVGGVAVLGGYAFGIVTHDQPGDTLWGGVPAGIRPMYEISMLFAAAGFLAMLYTVVLRPAPDTLERAPLRTLLIASLALILIPSAFWMSLTFGYVEQPTPLRWWLVRTVLFLVAIGSVALIVALIKIRPRDGGIAWSLAITGSVLFAFHTAVLDALLWPYLFLQ